MGAVRNDGGKIQRQNFKGTGQIRANLPIFLSISPCARKLAISLHERRAKKVKSKMRSDL